MNDGFDDEQDSSQVPSQVKSSVPELNARQREIYQNLKNVGPEIAAYYLDGIRILQHQLETPSLLAHIAREIDGGLRDILAENLKERLEFNIRMPNDERCNIKEGEKIPLNSPSTYLVLSKLLTKISQDTEFQF